jgi:hypothetical protein
MTKAISNATANAAKGDLTVGSGTNLSSVLGVGSNGDTIVADSSTATGLKWAAPGGGSNWTAFNAGGTALTGATTVTVSGISGANKIMVLVTAASSVNANSGIKLRLNNDSSGKYHFTVVQLIVQSPLTVNLVTSYEQVNSADNAINLGTMSQSAGSVVNGYVLLDGCNSTGLKMFTSAGSGSPNSSNDQRAFYEGGYYNSSSTISSVSIVSLNGAFDNGSVFVFTSA